MPFDPDAFLAGNSAPQKSGFDPDAFLGVKSPQEKPSPTWGDTAIDVAKQAATRPIAGVETMATWPAQLMGLAGKGLDYIGLGGDKERAAEQEAIRNLAAKQGGAGGVRQYLPKPTTETGRYVGAVAEMGPAAAASPGSLLTRAAGAVGAGVGQEGLGDLAAKISPELRPVGEVTGAVIGGGAASGLTTALRREPEISKELARAFIRDGDTPATINQRLAEIRQVRPEATVADVMGQNARGVLERIAQTPNAGLKTVIPLMEGKQREQMGRIADDLTAATGTRQSAFKAVEETMNARKTAATPLYDRAYQDGDRIVWNPELEQVASAPFVQSAMRKAVTTWRNQAVADGFGSMNPPHVPTTGRNAGNISFQGVTQIPVQPNLQFWDYTKRMLDDQISSALRAGQNQKAKTLTTLTQQLRTAVDKEVPSYAAARNAWSGPSRYMDAIEDGRSILNRNITAEELASNFGALSHAEQEGFRIGAVSAIRQRMESNTAELADFSRLLRSQDMRNKLAAIISDPNQPWRSGLATQRFARGLDYEVQSSGLTRKVLAGSPTARRQALQQEAGDVLGELAMHFVTHGKSGIPFFAKAIKSLAKPVQDTLRSRMDAETAKVLLGPKMLPTKLPQTSGTTFGPSFLRGITALGGFKSGGRVTRTIKVPR